MVYFVRLISTGRVKIGYSADVTVRMQTLLREHGPLDLLAVLHGSRKSEGAHHACFAHLRTKGEWFAPGEDLMAYVASMTSCEPVGPVARMSDARVARLVQAHTRQAPVLPAPARPPPPDRLALVEMSSAPRWARVYR